MGNKKWSFLSTHGLIFLYIAGHSTATTQSMAYKSGLSIRAVQTILDDLEDEGYLTRKKIGRNNIYSMNLEKPLRHRLEKGYKVGKVISALGIKVEKQMVR